MHPLKRPVAVSALIALAALLAASIADPADARSRGEASRDDFTQSSRPAGVPLLAVVSLNDQRVTIYDAEGKVLRAPVSTGQTGYETRSQGIARNEHDHVCEFIWVPGRRRGIPSDILAGSSPALSHASTARGEAIRPGAKQLQRMPYRTHSFAVTA